MEKHNKIKTLTNVTFAIFHIQSKIINQENMIRKPEKKSITTDKEMTRMVELAERDFKRAIINMFSDLKKNMNIGEK